MKQVLTFIRIIVCVLFLIIAENTKANNILGCDISYKHVSGNKYKILYQFYRTCDSSALSNPTSFAKVRGINSGDTLSINLSLVQIEEITTFCDTSTGYCNPSNTAGTGKGVEKHIYYAIVDFDSTPYSSLASECKLRFEIYFCCRLGSINTGAASKPYYNYAEMDRCKAAANSSPEFTFNPLAQLCCNQPVSMEIGAQDTFDFDSISYSWAAPYSWINSSISYSGTWYAANHPFLAYYPGSLQPPYQNPNASPPIGIYFSPTCGTVIFTPVRCDEVTVAVFEIKEWRKDSLGAYQVISTVRRDLTYTVSTCKDNNPPIVNGPYAYNVCAESEICFNITTNDPVFTPPPPATSPAPDTVRISWNEGIPGATFTVTNPSARLQTGQFCWTPSLEHARSLPYSFVVSARDNMCPMNAVTQRCFRVTVKHRAQATTQIDTLACGFYTVKSKPIDSFVGNASYKWEILDSNLNPVTSTRLAKFSSTGSFLSVQKEDTIMFRRGGEYIIKHTINNSPQNCPSNYFDTLLVPDIFEANLSIGLDSFLCVGNTMRLAPYLRNATNTPVQYQWSSMGVTNQGTFLNNGTKSSYDTLSYFDLQLPEGIYDSAVSIWVKDANNCTSEDTIRIFQKANPKVILPADTRICTYDSVLLIPSFDTAIWVNRLTNDTTTQADTLFKQWFYNRSIISTSLSDSIVLHRRGEYILRIEDSLGCADTDTFQLFVNDTVTAFAGLDRTLCFNDTIFLEAQGLDTAGSGKSGSYKWHNITLIPRQVLTPNNGLNTTYNIVAKDNLEYSLELYMTEGGIQCYDADSVYISVNQLPVINIRADKDICCDYGNISLNFDIISPTGGSWSCKTKPNWVNSNTFYTDSACSPSSKNVYVRYTYQDQQTQCVNVDSLKITVNPLPKLQLRTRDYCQDINEFRLKDALVISPSTYLGTPSWKCLDCNGNDFGKMLVDKGMSGLTDYWLKIDRSTYIIKNADRDTLILEFSYVNEKGCRSKDTVEIRLWRVPTITFSKWRALCWDEGKVSLNELTGVNLTDGYWSVYDSTGFRNLSEIGQQIQDTFNTLLSTPLASSTSSPNQWLIRYTHTSSGCPIYNDTFLKINPLPTINLSSSLKATANIFSVCESDSSFWNSATPKGGTWKVDTASYYSDTLYLTPKNLKTETKHSVVYRYTSQQTTCSSEDSLQIWVDANAQIQVILDTLFQIDKDLDSYILLIPYSLLNAKNKGIYKLNSDSLFHSELRLLENYIEVKVDSIQFQDTASGKILLYAYSTDACDKLLEAYISFSLKRIDKAIITLPQSSEIQIYPNPSTSLFDINPPKSYNLKIYDITGKLIYSGIGNQFIIETPGSYVAIAELEAKRYIKRISVVR